MAKRLFVGNLSLDAKDEDLQRIFSECGKVVSATVVKSKFDPTKSRGFGFVEMENDTEAQEAVNKINGTELNGRKIAVEAARPMERNRDFQPGGRNMRSGGMRRERRY